MKYLLMLGCIILMIVTWLLWLPYIIFVAPFTGKFLFEYELPMYPYYWIAKLTEKRNEDERK